MKSFDLLGLNNRLMEKISVLGLTEPTPIQYRAIPHILNGQDVMGLAQTGTGKTAAFALPILQVLNEMPVQNTSWLVRSLVLTPTRELAIQIGDNFNDHIFSIQ